MLLVRGRLGWVARILLVAVVGLVLAGLVETPATSVVAPVIGYRAAVRSVRVVFVGDIACDPSAAGYHGGTGTPTSCRQRAVGRLIRGLNPRYVVDAGDNQYDVGALSAYRKSYATAFGAFKRRTWPVPGNHEYNTAGAGGYFRYFGRRAGSAGKSWRSFSPVSNWRIFLLNSNCWAVGGCGIGSRQHRWFWMRQRNRRTPCSIAVWHHPYLTAGKYHGDPAVRAVSRSLWWTASRGGVDVVVNGHDHSYQRWALHNGIREFVVGTGGASHYAVTGMRGLRAFDDHHFGVLVLTLRSDRSYVFRFIRPGRVVVDSGRGVCRG